MLSYLSASGTIPSSGLSTFQVIPVIPLAAISPRDLFPAVHGIEESDIVAEAGTACNVGDGF